MAKAFAVVEDGSTGRVFGSTHEMHLGVFPDTEKYVVAIYSDRCDDEEHRNRIEDKKDSADMDWSMLQNNGFADTKIMTIELSENENSTKGGSSE